MSSTFFRKLPTPLEIKTMYPVPEAVEKQKQINDEEIRKIFTGESDKFAVIIGPCSADNQEAVEDYVGRLARVQEEVKDKLLLFLVFTLTSLVQQVRVTKVCFISLILKRNLTYFRFNYYKTDVLKDYGRYRISSCR